MITPEEQMQIIKQAIASGYKGPIYKLVEQAIIERSGQTATTEEDKKQGLRGSDGQTSMVFPNSKEDFNTKGMEFDLDIRKYDKEGNLVRSYDKVPPGIKNLDMGNEEGTVVEMPSQYQKGGVKKRKGETYVADKTALIKDPVKNTKQFSDTPMYEGHQPSTHLMAHDPKTFEAWPTLFQDDEGGWYQGDYNEAKKKNEVHKFKTLEEVEDFAIKGNWKTYQTGGVKEATEPTDVPNIHELNPTMGTSGVNKWNRGPSSKPPFDNVEAGAVRKSADAPQIKMPMDRIRDMYASLNMPFTKNPTVSELFPGAPPIAATEKDSNTPVRDYYEKSYYKTGGSHTRQDYVNNIMTNPNDYSELLIKRMKSKKETGGEKDTNENTYTIRVIQYPYGYMGGPDGQRGSGEMRSGHIEAYVVDPSQLPESWQELNKQGRPKYKHYVNRWVGSGNKPVRYNSKGDYEKGVRTVDLELNEDQLNHFMTTAQTFKPGKNTRIIGEALNDIFPSTKQYSYVPTSFGKLPKEQYDFLTSNCADGVCLSLGIDDDMNDGQFNVGKNVFPATDPTKVMDYLLTLSNASNATGEKKYIGQDSTATTMNALVHTIEGAYSAYKYLTDTPGTISKYIPEDELTLEEQTKKMLENNVGPSDISGPSHLISPRKNKNTPIKNYYSDYSIGWNARNAPRSDEEMQNLLQGNQSGQYQLGGFPWLLPAAKYALSKYEMLFPGEDKTESTEKKEKEIGLRDHMIGYLHDTGRDTSHVNLVMQSIGQHESKNNPTKKQDSYKTVNKERVRYDGPGRGTYQFEVGPDRGGNTAINRTANFLKHNTDKTIEDFPNINKYHKASNSLDFSTLSQSDQDALFIGDKIFGGKDRRDAFDAVTKNRKTPPSQEEIFMYWLKEHKGKVNGKNISELTKEEINKERIKWNERTKSIFKDKKQKGGARETVSTTQGSYYYKDDGSPMTNLEVAKKNKERRDATKKLGEKLEFGLSFAPYLGEAIDFKNTADALSKRKYGDAALHGAGFLLPLVPGGLVKKGYQKAKDLLKKKSKKGNKISVKPTTPEWSTGVPHYGNYSHAAAGDALSGLRQRGKHLDDIKFDASTLSGKNTFFHGSRGGRSLVEVRLPGGQTQMFYKSTSKHKNAWMPYGGEMTKTYPKGHKKAGETYEWFSKGDANDIENFYNSQSYRDIGGQLDKLAVEQGWDMSKQGSRIKKKGGLRKYQKGGGKGTSEFSLCSPIMDSNGEWFSSCANRQYAPLHNVYVGKSLTAGKKEGDFTASAALTAGYEFHPKGGTGNITGHIGGKYGVRTDNLMSRHINEAPVFDPFSQITGSLGYEGEIGDVHSYKRYLQGRRGVPLRWGAGAYAKQNLLGDKSTTVGAYGNIGQFTVSGGYNPKTGPEATIGFGFPFRKKGGYRSKNVI